MGVGVGIEVAVDVYSTCMVNAHLDRHPGGDASCVCVGGVGGLGPRTLGVPS